jgi:O-antigen/teichoic acid export membrane protein
MFFANIAAGVIGYTYQIFIGRELSTEDYGIFGALFGLFYLLGILSQALMIGTSSFISKFTGEGKDFSCYLRGLMKRITVFDLILFLFLVLAAPSISGLLNTGSSSLVIIVAFNVLFSLPLAVNFGVFLGTERFAVLGGSYVGHSLVKLVIGAALVSMGLGLPAALGAVAAASLLTLIASSMLVGSASLPAQSRDQIFEFIRFYKYSLTAALFSFCIVIPTNVDVIVVKRFFADEIAGLYAATTVLGKVIVFMPLGISMALFPKVSKAYAANEQTDMLLRRALLYCLPFAVSVTLIYWFFPKEIIGFIFGQRYEAAHIFVRWYGIAMLSFSLSSMMLSYHLARSEIKIIYAFFCCMILAVVMISIFHSSIMQIIMIILCINLAFFILSILNLVINKSRYTMLRRGVE